MLLLLLFDIVPKNSKTTNRLNIFHATETTKKVYKNIHKSAKTGVKMVKNEFIAAVIIVRKNV